MSVTTPIGIFQAFGVESEYMVVDSESLAVRPVVDELLKGNGDSYVSDVDCGAVAWSNELALHVVEMKTNGPAPTLENVAAQFHGSVIELNSRLTTLGCRLLPTAAHPWMNPFKEMKLWPHDYSPVYETFNRIFDCRGHGWANLQSCHLNLPFADDDEFGVLHAAIRLLLPLMPALAASSPILDGRPTGRLDSRLGEYAKNCSRIPCISGCMVPEPVYTCEEYRNKILQPMYRAISPLDPQGVLLDEFLNARGAIARFQRNTIEIRVLDMQECPAADIAIAQLLTRTLQAMVQQRWLNTARQMAFPTECLAPILAATAHHADEAVISSPDYLQAFGVSAPSCTAREVWIHIAESIRVQCEPWHEQVDVILTQGCLSRRILQALDGDYSMEKQRHVYRLLADSLASNRMFVPLP